MITSLNLIGAAVDNTTFGKQLFNFILSNDLKPKLKPYRIRDENNMYIGVDRKAALTDLYSADVINNIVAGLDTASRWGVKEGELSRASKIINSQFLNRITRLYIDDQIDVDEAVDMINKSLKKFN